MKMLRSASLTFLSVLALVLGACSPARDSDRYGIRHFAGRWEPVSRSRIDYRHGAAAQTTTDVPGGYLHLEVDRVKDDNVFYIDLVLGASLQMLGPLEDAQALTNVAGDEESTAYWDWGMDAETLSFIGKIPNSTGKVVTVAAISGLEKDAMTLTYTETLSDSSFFEEVLVLKHL